MSGSNLATCQLATWDENALKFELELGNENGTRKQTKTSRGWGGRRIRNVMESGN